ncbi:MAG: Hpt domain-containing protein [Deltaproteobacteria bacterium]|nr:Hpt domain-containing protein [Deltaproteobacteria bacterium]
MTGDPNNRPIDMNELSEIMDHDDELAKECFNDFLQTSSELLAKIKAAIDAKDADGLDQIAHRFKGTLKYLAATSAAEKAYELELMGKRNELNKADETYSALFEECSSVKAFMKKYCEQGMDFRA